MLKLLLKVFPFKEIGWKEIGETFYRIQLVKAPWFNIYLHHLTAPNPHPQCHDHPWSFYTIILKNGYCEYRPTCNKWYHRKAGTILFRPAEFSHNVVTCDGKPAWSLVFTGPRKREWGFHDY